MAIEEPSAATSFQVRDVAPDILLLGNLGAVQLNYGYGIDQCRRAVAMIGADGLILHLNVLQEAVQPEGNRNFKGLTDKITAVCRGLDVPGSRPRNRQREALEVATRLQTRGGSHDIAGVGALVVRGGKEHRARQEGPTTGHGVSDGASDREA